MKKITQSISLLIALLVISGSWNPVVTSAAAACAEPVTIASWEGCEPTVRTMGNKTEPNTDSAVVTVFYTSNGADYNTSDRPMISVEYGSDLSALTQTTDPISVPPGSQTIGFLLKDLRRGQTYYYRAVLSWVGGSKNGDIQQVKWATASTTTTGSAASTNSTIDGSTAVAGSTTTADTSDDYILRPTAPSTGLFGMFGTKKATTATTTTSRFKNVDEKSGFKLAIDDGVTKVAQGDTVTLKVRYENNNAKSYSDGVINIYLPDQYIVDTTNKGIHDKVDNMVSISLKEFPAGGFGTAIVIAKATGRSGDLDQAVSQASLTVGTVTLKVTDIDEYGAGDGSGNGLGASASGTGFLPGKLIGWILLLIVLAAIVIIGRRYFAKKDY